MLIRLAVAFGHRHRAIDQPRTDGIADAVERRKFAGGKLAHAIDDRLDQIGGRLGKALEAGQFVDSGDRLEHEQLFGGRCAECHVFSLLCLAFLALYRQHDARFQAF